MAKSNSEAIILRGNPIFKEAQASSAINPGHFIEFGGTKDIQAQATAEADCQRSIALENDLIGKDINDAYATGDRVRYGSFHQGQEVNVKVAASASAIVKGNDIEAAGDGTVRLRTSGTVIGYALNAVDNSSGTTETFLKIEVN